MIRYELKLLTYAGLAYGVVLAIAAIVGGLIP